MKKVDFAGTISCGTLSFIDLIPAVMGVAEAYAPRKAQKIRREYLTVFDRLRTATLDWDLRDIIDDVSCLWEELVYLMDELAPRGHYFGAHPADGADIGFWPVEETI